MSDLEKAQELLKRCYDLICSLPEQENKDISYEVNDLEITIYRYFK